mmetsp:Transcript_29920/g.50350  ORF Transcript_29920/g.50350 Transcript_29920/m.50350 type:complete len:210 (+) Transcript_29920:546-1175(+)
MAECLSCRRACSTSISSSVLRSCCTFATATSSVVVRRRSAACTLAMSRMREMLAALRMRLASFFCLATKMSLCFSMVASSCRLFTTTIFSFSSASDISSSRPWPLVVVGSYLCTSLTGTASMALSCMMRFCLRTLSSAFSSASLRALVAFSLASSAALVRLALSSSSFATFTPCRASTIVSRRPRFDSSSALRSASRCSLMRCASSFMS